MYEGSKRDLSSTQIQKRVHAQSLHRLELFQRLDDFLSPTFHLWLRQIHRSSQVLAQRRKLNRQHLSAELKEVFRLANFLHHQGTKQVNPSWIPFLQMVEDK